MDDKECKIKCVGAGSMLNSQHLTFRVSQVTPILYEDNLRGLVKSEDMKVAHSELATQVGAAGKEIIAFFKTSGGSAHIVYDNGDGCCGFTNGSVSELLDPALIRKVDEMWGPEK